MISWSRSASKRHEASLREVSEVRETPSLLFTLARSVACGIEQGGHRWVEPIERDQHAILIVMQVSVSGFVSIAQIVVKPFERRRDHVEILQALDVFAFNLGSLCTRRLFLLFVLG